MVRLISIGNIVRVLRISNIPSFQVFEELVKAAVKSQVGKVKKYR